MNTNRTIESLNSWMWYRFIKVVFASSIISALSLYNGLLISEHGLKTIDRNRTIIYCTHKIDKSFSPKDIGLYFSSDDLKGGFSYKDFFEGYHDYEIREILEKCYEKELSGLDIFAIQRTYEIKNKTGDIISEADNKFFKEEINKITTGYKTTEQKSKYLDYSIQLFDISPVFTYRDFVLYFVFGNVAILLIFEIVKRIFYYVVLGKFKPKKINNEQ